LSKITDLLAIPIGFLAIKALQGKVKDEETTPEVPIGFTVARKENIIKPFQIGEICLAGLPCGPAGTGPKVTGPAVPFGTGVDVVPFFPETAATADEVFPSNGTSDIAKLKDFKYKELKFDAWWLK
jgi:hypothetical protein